MIRVQWRECVNPACRRFYAPTYALQRFCETNCARKYQHMNYFARKEAAARAMAVDATDLFDRDTMLTLFKED